MSSASHDSSLRASPEKPWLGLSPYTTADSGYFFGREVEKADVADRVHRSSLTVLYGKSGKGKSSLICAGVIPILQAQGHRVALLRRCYDELVAHPLTAEVLEVVNQEYGLSSPAQPDAATAGAEPVEIPTLWEFFHDRSRPWCQLNEDGDPLTPPPVLIFDQFEEIFTKGEDRGLIDKEASKRSTQDKQLDLPARAHASDFLTQLADLVENRVPATLRQRMDSASTADRRAIMARYDFKARPVRVLLSLRDDFLHRLERQRMKMPSLMEQRFELLDLGGEAALQAVELPGRKIEDQGKLAIIEPEVARAIVCAAVGVDQDTDLALIEAVPPILSLLCERLNEERLERGESSIPLTAATPEKAKGILTRFYEEKLKAHPFVRAVLEDHLASSGGLRETKTREQLLSLLSKVPHAGDTLDRLVDDRILVKEEDRAGHTRFEFTHDQLARIAAESKSNRDQRRRVRGWIIGAVSATIVVAALSAGIWWALDQKRSADALASNLQVALANAKKSGEQNTELKELLISNFRKLNSNVRTQIGVAKPEDLTQSLDDTLVTVFEQLIAKTRSTPEVEELLATARLNKAGALKSAGKYAEAKPLFEAALEVKRKQAVTLEAKRAFAVIYWSLADLETAHGDFNAAAGYAAKYIDAFQKLVDDPKNGDALAGLRWDVAKGYWKIGTIRRTEEESLASAQSKISALSASLNAFTTAQKLAAELVANQPTDHDLLFLMITSKAQMGVVTVKWANADLENKDQRLKDASALLKEACALIELKAFPIARRPDFVVGYAQAHNWLGFVAENQTQPDWQTALKHQEIFRAEMKAVISVLSDSLEYKNDYAIACNKVSEAWLHLREDPKYLENALESAFDEVKVRGEIAVKDSGNLQCARDYAFSFVRLAGIFFDQELFKEAALQYKNAILVWTGYPILVDELKRNVDLKFEVAKAYGALAKCGENLKSPPAEIAEAFQSELKLLKELVQADGARKDWQVELMNVSNHAGFAYLHFQPQALEQAFEVFNAARVEGEKLIARDPSNVTIAIELGHSFSYLNDIHIQQRRYDDAAKMLESWRKLIAKYLENDKENPKLIVEEYHALWKEAGLHFWRAEEGELSARLINYSKADAFYEQALQRVHALKRAGKLDAAFTADPDAIQSHRNALQVKIQQLQTAQPPAPNPAPNPEVKQ